MGWTSPPVLQSPTPLGTITKHSSTTFSETVGLAAPVTVTVWSPQVDEYVDSVYATLQLANTGGTETATWSFADATSGAPIASGTVQVTGSANVLSDYDVSAQTGAVVSAGDTVTLTVTGTDVVVGDLSGGLVHSP